VIDADDPRANNSLGWLALRKKDAPTARLRFEQAIKADPDFLEPYVNLGQLCSQIGDVACARRSFEAYLKKTKEPVGSKVREQIRKQLAQLPKESPR